MIGSLQLQAGDRLNLDKSLQQALNEMQGSAMRNGVPKVFVLLTTSNQTPTGQELEKIKQIRALGTPQFVHCF